MITVMERGKGSVMTVGYKIGQSPGFIMAKGHLFSFSMIIHKGTIQPWILFSTGILPGIDV